VPVHHGHVDVLDSRPPYLQVGNLVAVLGQKAADKRGGVVSGVHEPLAAPAPAHLCLGRHLPSEPVGAAVGDNPAAGQDQDPIRELLGLVEVVRSQQDRHVLEIGQPMDEIMEVAPRVRVEASSGFVQEQQLRPADEADRGVQAATLPAGQPIDPLICLLGEPDRGEQLVHVTGTLPLGRGVRLVVPSQVVEQAAHLPPAVVTPRLQNHAEPRPP